MVLWCQNSLVGLVNYWSMTMDVILTLAAIMILLFLSAFLSGSETALTAARRSRIHQLEMAGDKRANLAARLISRRERLIGAILLGNNTVNILNSIKFICA